MQEITDENYRKIVRNFKGRMEFMNKTPTIDAVKIFFEICDLGISSYIKTEKKRFPDKSIKEIILEMHKFHEKMKAMGRKNKWK
ncbi:MAG: hypothetical protein CEE42_00390 [Promethearchaeota archaeon Loki_b31]|nr:MAG: hypothetical protein CEE42_00390 [Candidatus Lokiarchaeota archaeon Loki_b31]